jgi:DNA-binding transcriptional LysR family regulator
LNTRDLQAFVEVVDSGSMVRAAEKLHLTQPGLTRRVQNLESTLGVPLLDRQSKPLKPTGAGKEVYGLARAVLRSVDDLLAVAAPGSAPAGELKIGVPPFLSELALEMLLERAMRAEVDAAVVMMPASAALPEAVTATLLAVQPTVIVASRALEWPDQAGKKRGAPRFPLVELARHPWVLNQDGCGMRSALGRAFAASSLRFEVAVEAFGSELQLSLVARGVGLGVVTPHQLAASAHKDALQVIEAPEFSGGLNVWLVHGTLPGRLMRPMDLLRDTLVEALAQTQRQ